jgi:acetyl esterase/lipase
VFRLKTVTCNPNPNSSAKLIGYLHDDEPEMPHRKQRPCVVICPGGGYEFLSARESDPVAFAFFAKGYHVFILYYSVQEEAKNMQPLIDLSLSVMEIRTNSADWNIISDQIAVCGFSAGAHVAASLGTLWNNAELKEKIDTKAGMNKPNAMILCYPVITAGQFAHRGSISRVTGSETENDSYRFFSLEKQVSTTTPPAFLWHTVEDTCVPVENTLLFASALQQSHIPFECHIYPNGGHGQSMCNVEVGSKNDHCATWFPLCVQWLGELFGFAF